MKKGFTTALAILSLGGIANAQNNTSPGNMGGGDWTPAKCEAQFPAVKKYGESCMKIKALDKRTACVKAADSKFPPGLFKSCGTTFDPLQTELMAKEKQMYPTQASAFDHGGGGNNGGPNNGPNGGPGNMAGGPNGGPNNGPNGGPGNMPGNNGGNQNYNPADWNDSKCQAGVPKVTKAADVCMKVKDAGKRAECFDKVGKSMPPGFFEACRTQVEPLKQAYMAKEKELYPNQPSGVDRGGPNNGPNGGPGNMAGGPNSGPNNGPNGGPGNMAGGPNGGPNNGPNGGPGMNNGGKPNYTPADWNDSKCQAGVPKVTKGADACMKMKDAGKRAECFDKIGSQMPPGFFEACRTQVEPLKQAYMAKEKQLYPNQPSGIDHGGQNGGPNNGPNGGPGNTAGGPNGGPGMNNGGPGNMPGGPGMNNGGPGNMAGKKMDCGKVVSDTKAKAMKCLAIKTIASRKECGEKVGQSLGQSGADQACHDQVNQLHQDMIGQEKQKYPSQDSVL